MSEQNLYFNILTFDFPSEKQLIYFSKEDIAKSQKIHKSIFPKEKDSLFPGISSNCTDFAFTTFHPI